MNTPEAPERGAVPVLYGDGCGSINRDFETTRRSVVAGLAALLPTAAIARRADWPMELTERSLGGRALLNRVKAIGWLGAAEVVTPERTLRLGIDARVEPFVRARSTSWVAGQDQASARTLIIEPDAGFVERDGKRMALPEAQEVHERQQYGLYGYMLLRAPGVASAGDLRAAQPGLPPVHFLTGADGRLLQADYTVAAPDGGEVIQQVFHFEGEIIARGLRWPRRVRISQDGVPFFTLAIETLRVELA